MDQTRARPFKPSKPEDWNGVYDTVYQLYFVEDCTLEDMMKTMRETHNFCATKKQWVSKIGEWKLKKNVSSAEMGHIVRIQQKRKAESNNDTRFTVRGRAVAQANIDRWEKRQTKRQETAGPAKCPDLATHPDVTSASTPSDMAYETASDIASTPSTCGAQTQKDFREANEVSEDDASPVHSPMIPEAMTNMITATGDLEISSSRERNPRAVGDDLAEIFTLGGLTRDNLTRMSHDDFVKDQGQSSIFDVEAVHEAAVSAKVDLDVMSAVEGHNDGDNIKAKAWTLNSDQDTGSIGIGNDVLSLTPFGVGDQTISPDAASSTSDTQSSENDYGEIHSPGFDNQNLISQGDEATQFADDASIMEVDQDPISSSGSSDSSITVIQAIQFSQAVQGFERVILTQPTSGQEETNHRLRAAARIGNVELVRHLLRFGAEIESRSDSGTTALHAAVFYGHVDVASLLISRGADVEAPTRGDEIQVPYTVADSRKLHNVRSPRPIHLATLRGHRHVIQLLLDKQARVDSADGDEETALLLSVRLNLVPVAQLLIERGANVLVRGSRWPHTEPMSIATHAGNEAMMQLLLSNGAELKSYRPLMDLAVMGGHVSALRLLFDIGPMIGTTKHISSEEGLLLAIYHGHGDIARIFIDRGANLDWKHWSGDTALICAIRRGFVSIVDMLIDNGADIETRDRDGYCPLRIALDLPEFRGPREMSKLLINKGANANAEDLTDGVTALRHATWHGYYDVVELCIENGADINAGISTCRGMPYGAAGTPLMIAISRCDERMVQLLLNKGVDINTKGPSGINALEVAMFYGREKLARLLVDAGGSIPQNLENRADLLRAAVRHRSEYLVRLIVDNGGKAAASIKDSRDMTPIYQAAYGGLVGILTMLLEGDIILSASDSVLDDAFS
ncbi:ankyrin repeat-containing domain protein, partial [Cercophora newfieldiana]